MGGIYTRIKRILLVNLLVEQNESQTEQRTGYMPSGLSENHRALRSAVHVRTYAIISVGWALLCAIYYVIHYTRATFSTSKSN